MSDVSASWLPVYQPDLGEQELHNVLNAVKSGWISSKGQYVEEFAQAFCQYTNANFASTVANGTVAIHLALLALDIKAGDEIIVPTLTYVASVNPILQLGAIPVFVDSLKDTWQVDIASIENSITEKTKAIMVVHLYGLACDMDPIVALANKYNLKIIEDCAESFGGFYKKQHTGTFGDISTFSFYGNKTITTGEGGMVCAREEEVIERVNILKNQGIDPNKEYWHTEIAYNYRMTNIEAAIGCAQIARVEEILAAKKQVANWYAEAFAETNIEFHIAPNADYQHSYWMCSVLIPEGCDRDTVRNALKANQIETRPLFYPVHTFPMCVNLPTAKNKFPVANNLSSRGINLPSWPQLKHEQVNHVIKQLLVAVNKCGKQV